MTDAIGILDSAKRIATGIGLSATIPTFTPACASKGDFDELVTSYYNFFHEELSVDVTFLKGIAEKPDISQFTRTLGKLRTGAQHSGNADAKDFYRSWTSRYLGHQSAGEALAEMLNSALLALAHNAMIASRDKQHRSKWADITETDVSSVMSAVMADLGFNFKQGRLKYMVRQVEQRISIQPGTGSRKSLAQEYCVQELVSQRGSLPEPYFTVLDHLGLLGDGAAPGAILVAYSVAAIAPSLRGTEFLCRVEETWRAAAAY
ncbi:hypothetical protein LJR013_002639 [Pseudarthrobacter oxydans]|uniref:hypothetical protein n=1 Tax=Pseudarthrobacter oxydans TaxID=1671 RepID=UPI003ECFBE8A